MKQPTFTLACILALLGALLMAGCSTANSTGAQSSGETTSQTTFNSGSGPQRYKPVTRLLQRVLVSNYFQGALDVVDALQNRLTTFSFLVGAQPTYLQPSPDGTLTIVNNTGSGTLSSFNNLTEAVKTIQLGGGTESFVTSADNKSGYAAVPGYSNGSYTTAGAIVRFNPTDASIITPAIPFANARYIALDPSEKHLLAFADTNDNAYWVDLTATDPNTQAPPVVQLSALRAGTFSRPVAAFFSADGNTAYVLSCGAECGGTDVGGNPSQPRVTAIDVTNNAATPSVLQQWIVKGARRGLIDLTAKKLYVAGSSANLTDSGGNKVQDGWFTAVDLSTPPASNPMDLTGTAIRLGNGAKRWIRNIHGTFWIASLNCGVQNCVTIVDPVAATAKVLANPKCPSSRCGDATGITDVAIHNSSTDVVYTIEGGELFIYDQQGNPVTSEFPTDVSGQGSDVLYIDNACPTLNVTGCAKFSQ